MEALRISEYVGENGINIGINKLKGFKNKRVEIIILPMDEEKVIEKTEKLDIGKEFFISEKVKSITGILKVDKTDKELKEEIINERISKYEDIL